MFKKLLISLCLLPVLLLGLTVESDRFDRLFEHADARTIVFCDLDNTLFESSTYLGSVAWRNHIRNKGKAAGLDAKQTEDVLDKFWSFVQPFVSVRLVDQNAPEVIQKLRGDKVLFVILTARDHYEKEHTLKQLESLNVALPQDEESRSLSLPSPALYDHGILFCGENSKGAVVRAFLEEMGLQPDRIVLIDDLAKQLADVEGVVKEKEIEFVGIRFSGADARVKAFDPQIADLQWQYLPQLLTDEEAQSLLQKR